MVTALVAAPQAGAAHLLQAGSGLSQTRTQDFQPLLVSPPTPASRRSLSVRMVSTSNSKASNGRPIKGISAAEAAERRRLLNKPVPAGDQLAEATNELLNVIAYPLGLGVLAASLPLIWTSRLASEAFSQPMDMRDKVVLITGASSGIGEVS